MEKNALITGGATGIGKQVAIRLAKLGINLAINYRNSEQAAFDLANELSNDYGTKNFPIKGDISSLNDCQAIIHDAREKLTNINIIIHNAGPYVKERKRMTDYSFEEWDYLINGNLNGVFYLSKLLIPGMRENRWGRIITFGYDRVETAPGWIYRSAFSAAKTGLASLTRTIALEEAEFGITANMVCPGDIIEDWKEKGIVDAMHEQAPDVPIGRPGTGEDISRVISFLLDDHSGFITGSIIPVTGGKDVLGKIYKK